MPANTFQYHHYTEKGLPFICHAGYIGKKDTPKLPNWHADLELVVGTFGEGYVEYDTRQVQFKKGEMVVINTGITHRIRSESRVEYYYALIDPKFIEESGFDLKNLVFEEKITDEKLVEIFMRMVDNIHSEDDFRLLKARIAVSELLLELIKSYAEYFYSFERTEATHHVKKAIEFIRSNFSKQIAVQDVAKYVGISQSRLAKEFRQFAGNTVLEQINMIRCNQAKTMIMRNEKISDAATLCGFENHSYFAKTYKKIIGELPSETQKRVWE